MKKLLDLTYIEHERTANWLARLCYPIAVSIEVKQPATALRFMEAVFEARNTLNELSGPYRPKNPERKIKRALLASKCVYAILKRISADSPKEPARVTAATEVAEHLVGMLTSEQATP